MPWNRQVGKLTGRTVALGVGAVLAEVATQATLTATMALGANPICANLTGVLDTLIDHATVESSGTSMIGDENWPAGPPPSRSAWPTSSRSTNALAQLAPVTALTSGLASKQNVPAILH
jgi:hypothetical protein